MTSLSSIADHDYVIDEHGGRIDWEVESPGERDGDSEVIAPFEPFGDDLGPCDPVDDDPDSYSPPTREDSEWWATQDDDLSWTRDQDALASLREAEARQERGLCL